MNKQSLLEQLRIERPSQAASNESHRKFRLIWLIAVIAIVAIGSVFLWKVASTGDVVVKTDVAHAIVPNGSSHGEVGSQLDASGYVVALRDATVSAKAIYRVNEILVQRGEMVRAGQIIAQLDDSNVRAALEESVSQMRQMRASLVRAKVAAEDYLPIFLRQRKELAEGLISQDAFDSAKANYDAAKAQVVVAERQVAVSQASVNINQRFEDDTVIRAPFDGVITAKNAQPGQIVSPQFSGGGSLAEVVDMNSLEVDVDVGENFISRVYPRQPATITLDAYPEWHVPAEVIAIVPTADKTKATVQVRVGFKKTDTRILPQLGARVSFLTNTQSSGSPVARPSPADIVVGDDENAAVAVSAAAVETGIDRHTGIVFVIDGNKVVQRTVRLGARHGKEQWILSGLDSGTRVAIGDFRNLHDGVRVRFAH